MFLELFLERLSCLCEILGRECMQAFCSSWTPNTHNTARFNVIICSERRNTPKQTEKPFNAFWHPEGKGAQGVLFFPPNTQDPQQSTTRFQEKHPGCQQQNLTTEGRSQCLRNKGFTVGWFLPLTLQAMFSRTMDRGSALANISFFLEAVLVSIHVCWAMYLGVCVIGKSEQEIQYLSSLPFLLHAD